MGYKILLGEQEKNLFCVNYDIKALQYQIASKANDNVTVIYCTGHSTVSWLSVDYSAAKGLNKLVTIIVSISYLFKRDIFLKIIIKLTGIISHMLEYNEPQQCSC